MVRFDRPPPHRDIEPTVLSLPRGTKLVRLFNAKYLRGDQYNHNGPRGRFDHHAPVTPPNDDPVRGIYYAATDLEGAVIEVFGDTGVIEPAGYGCARVETTEPLRILQLRGKGCWNAGSVSALEKSGDRDITQEWARHFYERTEAYGLLAGISYGNAHDDAQAYALFERAGTLTIVESFALDDPRLVPELDDIALRLRLTRAP